MNIFKKYLIIVPFLIITSLNAKQMGQKAAPRGNVATQPSIQPVQPERAQPQQPQPVVQPKRAVTFRELVTTIKNNPADVVWNNGKKLLQQNFVNDLVSDAKAANFSLNQLEALLVIARDSHAQFTGNNDQDAQILTNINNQINNALANLAIATTF